MLNKAHFNFKLSKLNFENLYHTFSLLNAKKIIMITLSNIFTEADVFINHFF